jgi:hypothetical protein
MATTAAILPADVLTFEGQAAGECGTINPGFTEGAYTFNYSQGTGAGKGFACINTANPISNGLRFSSNGTQTLGFISTNFASPGSLSMFATLGGAFDLVSLDLAQLIKLGDFAYPANASGVTVTGALQGGGTVTDTLNITIVSDGPGGHADFATFLLPGTFRDLTSVTFTPTGGSGPLNESNFLMDNIVVTPTAVVPEPGAVLLLGTVLLICGSKLRNRRATR